MTAKDKGFVFIGPQISKNERLAIRDDGETKTPCIAIPIKNGKPLPSDSIIVSLSHIEGDKYKVIDECTLSHNGPAKVNSEQYKENWDKIFN